MTDRQRVVKRSPGTRLGRIAGVPIGLNPSWPVSLAIVIVVVALLAGRVLPDRSVLAVGIAAVILTVLLMVSVLLHELGHLFAARSMGQRVVRIRFDVLGGQTDLAGSPSSAGRDGLVAVAGPLVSALCAAAGFLLSAALDRQSSPWLLASTIGVVNALLAVFNLLPALPLDGGEVVRTIAWRISGSRRIGTIVGYLATAVVCLLLLGLAVLRWSDDLPGGRAQGVVIAAMVLHLAGVGYAEWRQEPDLHRSPTEIEKRSSATAVASAAAPIVVLPRTSSAAEVRRLPAVAVLVDHDGVVVGIVDPGRLAALPPGDPAISAAVAVEPAAVLLPSDDTDQLAEALARTSADRFLLADPDGRPAGVLSRAVLTRILSDRSPLGSDRGGNHHQHTDG